MHAGSDVRLGAVAVDNAAVAEGAAAVEEAAVVWDGIVEKGVMIAEVAGCLVLTGSGLQPARSAAALARPNSFNTSRRLKILPIGRSSFSIEPPYTKIFSDTPNIRIDATHRPGLRPEDEAPTGQLTNEIIFGRLESS